MEAFKIYLASWYSRLLELCANRDKLREMGFIVTSRWLDTEWLERDNVGSAAAPPEYRAEFAVKDMEDVMEADTLVFFTEPPGAGGQRGGRHVEFGIALATGKQLIIVGEPENLFHHHPVVQFVEDVPTLLDEISLRKPTTGRGYRLWDDS